jgi:hypothetical protein
MLMAAKYQDPQYGYMVSNFLQQVEYDDIDDLRDILRMAQKAKEDLRDDIITIHRFVIDLLS